MLRLRWSRARTASWVVPFLLVWASAAGAVTITFDDPGLEHGEIIDVDFAPEVTISAFNNSGPDISIIFDTTLTGTRDPDLEGPVWSGGNLDPNTVLGNILVIAEFDFDQDFDGRVDWPDDEGSRPAGFLRFDFADRIGSFGLDLIDIEPQLQEMGSIVFYADEGTGLMEVGSVDFEDLLAMSNFGDNTINRVAPLLAFQFGVEGFDRVEIHLGGSGGVDNITYESVELPEPGTAMMLLLGLVALGIANGGFGRAKRTPAAA